MRIIAGKLGGRTFDSSRGRTTRPMSEKVRGALFNTLGDIEGLSVLDGFAGSGALSFEAISRGAKHAVAVDTDRSAHNVIEKNVKELRLENQVKAVRANVAGWSIHNMEKKFDLLLFDPPYEELNLGLIQKLIKRHLKKSGLAVLSYPGHTATPDLDGVKAVANKDYGDAKLVFYRKKYRKKLDAKT